MIKVLLIGKFPPAQGGTATKTWRLAKTLLNEGIIFEFIGLPFPSEYTTPDCREIHSRRHIVLNNYAPWFLPGGSADSERLAAMALETARKFKPDLIEVNYLATYALPAAWTAKTLGLPLLVRHAGSDVAKFLKHSSFKAALSKIIEDAAAVVTPLDLHLTEELPGVSTNRFHYLPRYVPNPEIYNSLASYRRKKKHPFLLYVGKCNYHWELRALELAARAIAHTRDWRFCLVCNGNGLKIVKAVLEDILPYDRLFFYGFVSPDRIPAWLHAASAVWVFERKGGVSDFSNTIWEAAACGTPVIINAEQKIPTECELLQSRLTFVEDSPLNVAKALEGIEEEEQSKDKTNTYMAWRQELQTTYARYIRLQSELYKLLAEQGRGD